MSHKCKISHRKRPSKIFENSFLKNAGLMIQGVYRLFFNLLFEKLRKLSLLFVNKICVTKDLDHLKFSNPDSVKIKYNFYFSRRKAKNASKNSKSVFLLETFFIMPRTGRHLHKACLKFAAIRRLKLWSGFCFLWALFGLIHSDFWIKAIE